MIGGLAEATELESQNGPRPCIRRTGFLPQIVIGGEVSGSNQKLSVAEPQYSDRWTSDSAIL